MLVFTKHFSQVDVMTGMKCFSLLKFAAILGIFSSGLAISFGQNNSNISYQVANVVADVRLLDERLRLINAELEEMRRENAVLRRNLVSSQSQVDANMNKFATIANVNSAVADAVRQLEKRDDLMKDEIVLQVTKQIKEFAMKVNKTIGKIPSAAPKDNPKLRHSFPKNYPDNGVVYKVKSGDNLGSIAKAHNSTVDWIQNANERPDASYLLVGEELFIPIPE